MEKLEEIKETPRTGVINDPVPAEKGDSTDQKSPKRKRSKGRRNSTSSRSRSSSPPSEHDLDVPPPDHTPLTLDCSKAPEEKQKADESGEHSVLPDAVSPKKDATPTQKDHRNHFYGKYREVAAEYDEDFLKKHDEDLNTTLIFAGLFSAVTSAFIIDIGSQLQSDPNEETAALLRVLIYKFDNTAFGGEVPTPLQWTGPPNAIVQVQAILYSSLAISLVSAFLAMLGKQWLTRYKSIDKRGSAIERSHDRQRKLDGVIVWFFDYVMELLPLMLQAGLLLLASALTRYLWGINIVVASVILGITLACALFYLFIVIAGTVYESCPYQTPFAHIFRYILRHLRRHLLTTLYSTYTAVRNFFSANFSRLFELSACLRFFPELWAEMRRPWYSIHNIGHIILAFLLLPVAVMIDVYALGQAALRSLNAFGRAVYRRIAIAYPQIIATSLKSLDKDYKKIVLDLRCISWILRTSLDEVVHIATFEHLASMPKLARFPPTLVVDCFNLFIDSVSVSNSKVVVVKGSKELATASANGFSRALHHLVTTDPTSGALTDIRRRYNEVFPSELDFKDLEFHSAMAKIHALAGRFGDPRDIEWPTRKIPVHRHAQFAQDIVKTAKQEYQQRTQDRQVPRWILRSALYFLSLGPLSPASVIADSLTIVAVDLDCDIPNVADSDESARVERISNLITQKLEAMAKASNSSDLILSKRKAVNTLFPYAIYLEEIGQPGMIDVILRAAKALDSSAPNAGKFMWSQVVPYISRLFEERSPTSMNRVIALISPYVPWDGALNNKVAVARWAAAAKAIPYSDDVGSSVVDALLQIATIDFLQARIPKEIWEWMKKQPPLPPMCYGVLRGGYEGTFYYIRGTGDLDLLKCYFLIRWTERYTLDSDDMRVIEMSIREDFSGAAMAKHREDFIKHLDFVIGRLDRSLGLVKGEDERAPYEKAKGRYKKLKDILVEVDGQ